MVETGQEQLWIEQSRQGDDEAFEHLIRMHQRMIHGITFRMTGSLEDADDLAQETFVQAFRQLEAFRGESKFSSWLCRVAINTSLNWRRRETRRQELQRIWAAENILEKEPSAPTNVTEDMNGRIQAALARLSPQQRAAVILTVYEGMNHAAAARALGCAETTVSWRLFTARRKLRHLLETTLSREDRHSE
jgi:RNA polymerase sigma-70 factor, ECF subfamily